MSFPELLPWQQATWTHLQATRDRLPHSLLFSGPAGLGKNRFAQRFAASARAAICYPSAITRITGSQRLKKIPVLLLSTRFAS